MTTTFNTGNPIGSTAAKDLSDNASNFDDAVNTSADTWVDRLAVTRDTVNGRLKKMGYAVPITYAGGISFTANDNVKTVEEDNKIYAPFASELPFTTTGTWGVIGVSGDNLKFFVVRGLTVDIANTLYARATFNTLNSAKADTSLLDGHSVDLKEYATGTGGGGIWDIYPSGTFTVSSWAVNHDTLPLQLVLRVVGLMDFRMFGAIADGAFNNTPILEDASLVTNSVTLLSSAGAFNFTTVPTLPSEFTTYIGGQTAITGLTAIEAQAVLISAGNIRGYPVAENLRYSGIEIVAGTLRQRAADRTLWDWIQDGSHEPVGVDASTPAIASGSVLTVPFLKTYSRVISLVCCPDESLANSIGFKCGPSSGLSFFEVKASVNQVLSAQIWYDGAVWQWAYGPGQGGPQNFGVEITSIAFNSGHITINHDNINGSNVSITPWTQSGDLNPYPVHLRTLSPTTKTELSVRSWTGGYVTVADTNMSFIYNKQFDGGILMDGTGGSESYDLDLGNIWFYGIMEV